jgi:predicted outer membrane protein
MNVRSAETIRGAVARRTAAFMVGALVGLAGAPAGALAAPVAPTQLNAADMTLFNGVRLAGLWEIPAGQMAAEKGKNAKVREIGTMIAEQHVELDQLVVDAANKLGATLPSTPNSDQQGWLKEMENANGDRFDQAFVTRLRAAHGKIFPVIGAVRASTRNPVVRKLADEANVFVMHHMQMLESTGLVRYTELPPAAIPAAQDNSQLALAKANAGISMPASPAVIWVTLIAAVGIAGFVLVRLRRSGV